MQINLTMFENILKSFLNDVADTDKLEEELLMLENIDITFTSKML